MESEKIGFAPLVLKLATYEAEYIQSDCTRTDLEEKVQSIQHGYESIGMAHTKGDRYYLAMMLLFLERIKISIALEDEIVEIIDFESSFFNNNINRLIADLEKSCEHLHSAGEIETKDSGSKSSKSRRMNYSKSISRVLKKWLQDNIHNPYPSDAEKGILREKTGLDSTQLNNWLINARRRILPLFKSSSPTKKSKFIA